MAVTERITIEKSPSRKTKDGLCPVKLVVTHDRKRKYYSLKKFLPPKWQYLSESDFNKATGESPRGRYRDISNQFKMIDSKAREIINDLPLFSFQKFKERFFKGNEQWDDVYGAFQNMINMNQSKENYSTYYRYRAALSSLKKFNDNKPLSFRDIDADYLKRFEKWLLNKVPSPDTAKGYIIDLRTVFNEALRHNVEAEYPFSQNGNDGKYKMLKPSPKHNKLMDKNTLKMICEYEAMEGSKMDFYKDIFTFSLLAQGMNLTDIFHLKFKNITTSQGFFIRQKTRNTSKVEVNFVITKRIQNIIDKHKVKKTSNEDFIFGVLNNSMTEKEIYNRCRQEVRNHNNYIRKIASRIGIEYTNKELSSYTARHSYSQLLFNNDVSPYHISVNVGHQIQGSISNYIAGLDFDNMMRIAKQLEKTIFGYTIDD